MKKKVLVNGVNTALVKDIIQHSGIYFDSISTTDCWDDLGRHFELFKPDAYLLFPESADDIMVSQINKLKSHYTYNGCPIIICAPIDVCAVIQRNNPKICNLMLKRPVSADNLALRIIKYWDDEEKKKEALEKRKQIEFIPEEIQAIANEAERKKHILIVDDDRSILKMLKTALETDYEVTTMVNGILVEKFLDSKNVDLVILDYEMPIKTGAEVIRDIKNHEKSVDIPICFLTGVAERDKIMEILALKPDAYMLKPVNMEALLATVSNLID